MELVIEKARQGKKDYNLEIVKKCGLYETIKRFEAFLDVLGNNIFSRIITYGDKLYFMPIQGIDSSKDSLSSIIDLCITENIIDGYVLIRKIRDNLLLFLFFLSASKDNHAPSNSKINYIGNKGEIDIEQLILHIENRIIEEKEFNQNDSIKSAVKDWLTNNLDSDEKRKVRRNFFGYERYIENLIKLNSDVNGCYDLFFKEVLEDMSKQLNNYVHSNGLIYLSNNMLKEKYESEIIKMNKIISNLKTIFLSFLFLIDSTSLVSCDYIFALEEGISIGENAKYFLFPSAIESFNDIRINNSKLFEFLEEHNKYGMFIKKEDYD